MDIYGHLFDGLDEGAADVLDTVLAEAAVPDTYQTDNISVAALLS